MLCKNCGAQNEDSAIFCYGCGAVLSTPNQSATNFQGTVNPQQTVYPQNVVNPQNTQFVNSTQRPVVNQSHAVVSPQTTNVKNHSNKTIPIIIVIVAAVILFIIGIIVAVVLFFNSRNSNDYDYDYDNYYDSDYNDDYNWDSDLTSSENETSNFIDDKRTSAEEYIQKAEEAFKKGDVNAAIGNAEAAADIYPDGGYESKVEEYKLYLPFALYKEENVLKREDGTGYGLVNFTDGEKSNDDREFNNIIRVSVADEQETFADIKKFTYNLAGKYDRVTGTIFLLQKYKNYSFSGYFEAYGDGKLLYTSPKITSGVLPQEVNFDVTGVRTLEIIYYGKYDELDLTYHPQYGIANFEAKKNIPQ